MQPVDATLSTQTLSSVRRSLRLQAVANNRVFRIEGSHPNQPLTLLSTRARNMLKAVGIESLRDFDGVQHQRILEHKNCGYKTYDQIVRFAEAFALPPGTTSNGKEVAAGLGRRRLNIPEKARCWEIIELPFSPRLRHAMERLNCRTLGDLQGLPRDLLTRMPDCGVRTRNELRNFLQRVEKGDFGTARDERNESVAAFLVSKIDSFLQSLPRREHGILIDRVGASDDPMTLMNVGRKYGMTRERVRQIVNEAVDAMLRDGGPPFARCLKDLSTELDQNIWPLTPALLERLLAAPAKAPELSMAFYLRLLGWLSPTISVWVTGQDPAAYRTTGQERVIRRLKEWFEGHETPVRAVKAYRGITEGDFRCTPGEFLDALRFAAEFGVDLTDPISPRIHPPVKSPGRWARQILANAAVSAPAPETLARAHALRQYRRSPGSAYRLASVRKP